MPRPANTLSSGFSASTGVRGLRTFGDADGPQWTVGADWRRFEQRYLERDVDKYGHETYEGSVYGVPQNRNDDVGVLTDLELPVGERLSLTLGGRVDYTSTWLNADDSIIELSGGDYEAGFTTPNYTLGMAYAMAK